MKPVTEQEIKKNLSTLLWDSPATADDVYELLMHDKPCRMEKHTLYIKILMGFRWYKILKIIPPEKLKYAFSDEVLKGVFPPKIKQNYYNVRSLLFE